MEAIICNFTNVHETDSQSLSTRVASPSPSGSIEGGTIHCSSTWSSQIFSCSRVFARSSSSLVCFSHTDNAYDIKHVNHEDNFVIELRHAPVQCVLCTMLCHNRCEHINTRTTVLSLISRSGPSLRGQGAVRCVGRALSDTNRSSAGPYP